jgi:hypothetical protein
MFSWALRLLLLKLSKDQGGAAANNRLHSRYRKEYLNSLSVEDCRHCSRKIPRISLISLPESPWRKLLTSQVDQAMITMTGFDCLSFQALLQKFAPLFDNHLPFNRSHIEFKSDPSLGGRPRNVRPEDCLGLVLVWMHTRGSLRVL